jgi:DNA-binding response OmpR family regulator
MNRIALNIQRDAETRRVVSEALSTFSPGFHVTSASDLDTATEWMVVLEPELVVLGSDIAELEAITAWMAENDVDQSITLVVGSTSDADELGAAASVDNPLALGELMNTVRRVAADVAGPAPTTSATRDRGA